MRTDKELIKICIDNFDNFIYSGLCILTLHLTGSDIISYQEQKRILSIFYKYIKTNTAWNRFRYNKDIVSSYEYLDENSYFWEPNAKEPRLKFLQYLYNKLK